MFTIDINNIRIIPLDFCVFFLDASNYIGRFKFSKKQYINEAVFKDLMQEILENNDKKIIGVDMSNISSYPMHIFSKISSMKMFFSST